jgi:glycopeptide antibiotics resistance protein
MQNKVTRIVLWIALVGCMLVLAKFILFKKSPSYYKNYFQRQYSTAVIKKGMKNANLKPFTTIKLFYNSRLNRETKYENIGGNLLGFVPLGIFLPLLFWRLRNIFRTTLAVLLISLMFETTQLLTGLGAFDIDDLILNAAGGLLGYIFYAFIRTTIDAESVPHRVLANR